MSAVIAKEELPSAEELLKRNLETKLRNLFEEAIIELDEDKKPVTIQAVCRLIDFNEFTNYEVQLLVTEGLRHPASLTLIDRNPELHS